MKMAEINCNQQPINDECVSPSKTVSTSIPVQSRLQKAPQKTIRKKRKRNGRKERLSKAVKRLRDELAANSQLVKKSKLPNSLKTSSKRSINVSKHSSSVCGTKESCNMPINHYTIPKSVKRIACKDLKVSKEDFLGKGVYGKCFSGKIAHLSVCVKAFREQSVYKSTFALEATLLSQCCHANLPWLYGAVFHPKAIVISLHVIEGNSITIHSMCCSSCSNSQPVFTTENWKKILYGVVSAISYLHKKFILHNDIKSNNVVIDKKGTEVNSILIDLGKGCFVKDAKSYHLPSDAARREHVKNYPHIAPDLINGHCKQSTKSDVYSLGRIIHQVNDHHLRLPALESLSKQCMEYYCENRLQITEINTFTYNLFY